MDEKEIIKYYLKPNSLSATARHFNCCRKVIKRALENNNITLHDKKITNKITADKHRLNLSTKVVENIVKDYLKPMSINDISIKYGYDKKSIKKILENNHIKMHTKSDIVALNLKKKQKFNKDQEQEIITFYKTPQSLKNTAEHFNCNRDVISRILKNNNVKMHNEETLKEISIQNAKRNFQNNYGVDNPQQLENIRHKTKQTTLQRYGVENYSSSDECREKVKKTNLTRYGTELYSKTEEFKIKVYNTKKQNNTFHVSKPEEDYYDYLLDKFGKEDVIRQYKDSRYPFACDFYIKSQDLFIELNLHWSHGFKPFDKNNKEDLKKLEIWKEKAKTSRYYKNAIKVWIEKDVEKQRIAKENNLNYIMIYLHSYLYVL